MRMILKRNEWHRLIGGGSSEENTINEFNAIQEGQNWFDWGDTYVPEGKENIKGALPRYLNFSFKVIKINEDSVVLEVSGDAGGTPKEDFSGFTPKQITLSLNEEMEFQTNTRDCGIGYSLTLLNDEDVEERMPFSKFNRLFLTCRFLDKAQTSIFAPIIYNMEDKYYSAAVKYLQAGTITQLSVGEITIADILCGYWLTQSDEREHYLEALTILNNIEKIGAENAWEIFNPYVIE